MNLAEDLKCLRHLLRVFYNAWECDYDATNLKIEDVVVAYGHYKDVLQRINDDLKSLSPIEPPVMNRGKLAKSSSTHLQQNQREAQQFLSKRQRHIRSDPTPSVAQTNSLTHPMKPRSQPYYKPARPFFQVSQAPQSLGQPTHRTSNTLIDFGHAKEEFGDTDFETDDDEIAG